MRLHRFHVLKPLGEEVVFDTGYLLHQWAHVFRYSTHDQVILFNGDGFDYLYELVELTKKSATLAYISKHQGIVPTKKVHIYLASIKKDAFELATQKAVELGVSSITPIITSRTQQKHLSYERLGTIATEALEQCMRADTFHVHKAIPFEEALQQAQGIRFMLSMGGTRLLTHPHRDTQEISCFIGPEGGFTDEELAYATRLMVEHVSLTSPTLRAETAVIAVSSILLA